MNEEQTKSELLLWVVYAPLGRYRPAKMGLASVAVPSAGSGSGELGGLAGTMSIEIADGRHSYRFDYSLPAEPPADSAAN